MKKEHQMNNAAMAHYVASDLMMASAAGTAQHKIIFKVSYVNYIFYVLIENNSHS